MNEKKRIPVRHFCRLASTNDYAKRLKGKEKDRIIVALSQTKGRGREGRTFSSGKGGLYMTWLHFPKDLPAKNAFTLVQKAAVAVCKTVESYGVKAEIKWPNDVLVDGKKICGVLTENALKGDKIFSSIIGVGLNVNNRLEEVLQPVAITLQEATGKKIPVREVEKRLIVNLLKDVQKEEYFSRLGYLGEVCILEGEKTYPAYAEGVSDEGLLLLTVDGERVYKSAAEISLRRGEER